MSTDIVPVNASQLPAVSDAFVERFPGLNPEIDITSLLEESLGPGGEIRLADLTKIKVPSAELEELMVPDELGKPRPVEELDGVPVAMTSRRSFWPDTNPVGNPPECSSRDLVHGVGRFGPGSEENPSGLCGDCPMSKIGSINKIDARRTGNASACKEQRLLFMLTDRELLPLMIVIPAGSLTNHKAFGMALLKRGIRGPLRGHDEATGRPVRGSSWLAVEVGLGLEQDTNGEGQKYNKLTFGIKRKLDADEQVVVDAYGRFVDTLIAKQAEQLDAVANEAASFPADTTSSGDPEGGYDDDGEPIDDLEDEATTPSRGRR